MINSELMLEVAEMIRTEPDQHQQDTWGVFYGECGYQACVAGHTLIAEGWVLTGSHLFKKDGHVAEDDDVGLLAASLLELEPDEANVLFHGRAAPKHNLTWPEALEKAASGTPIRDLFTPPPEEEWLC